MTYKKIQLNKFLNKNQLFVVTFSVSYNTAVIPTSDDKLTATYADDTCF